MSFLIWALAGLAATYWGLRLFAQPLQAPPGALTPADDAIATRAVDLTRLLGADENPAIAPPPAADARFKLVGVAAARGAGASGPGGAGWAAIAVDGKPSRTYRLGDVVDADLVVHGVTSRTVLLGPRDGAATMTLSLPQMPPAATGQLVVPQLQERVVGMPVGLPGAPAPRVAMPGVLPGPAGAMPPGMISNGGPPNLGVPEAPGAVPGAMTPMVPVPADAEPAIPPLPQID